ncbi:hydroxymethylbilane synthase [Corynebacterium macginleyi]|uniref:Porphobilinogen deaminase n=1 Tax=Corynebacterium macginleyi TaxID=38290 RepID=A0A3M0GPI4_9CORY|nr:hydroxymethylbilane synthase [Corynebacterium macginleyi]MBK4139199.1 hydroxymethylbilane synthase [Corynebacterium macginleyi]MBK4143996.1 hydroxymethylbilane synthase [Corynebacterium macginleyi]MBK4150719.1 hydroxymethylbilane synthase [Corynebacterium macginleyi]MBK4152035.1 hydroxymethylbilane synthase [Corynebacterium macginleyi]MBK4156922.1 hydroxymethylbilane synthase [Corynebacterium macginleyi]
MFQIGTRGSKLATTQAGHVRDWLIDAGFSSELHIVTTAGDINMAPVERIGVGVFTQALREALYRGECDIAVHSFKDLPTAADERFRLVIPQRQDSREALVARDGLSLMQLPEGARVGTSAPRRISQLAALRPDLEIRPLRGNIDTRMSKVTDGELDAVVLAYAGLLRGGYEDRVSDIFDPEIFMPAPAQGALAIEAVAGTEAAAALDALVDVRATAAALAERAVLARLEAGCTAPVAATSRWNGDQLTVRGGVFALDGSRQLTATAAGTAVGTAVVTAEEAMELGAQVSDELFAQGAADLLGQ